MDDSPEVGIDLVFELVGCHFFECADETVASVIHDHIDPAKRFLSRGNGFFGVHRGGDIEFNRANAIAVNLAEISQLLWFTRRGDDQIPGFEHHFSESASQSAGTTSNEPNFRHK